MIYDIESLLCAAPYIVFCFIFFYVLYWKHFSSVFDPVFFNIVLYISFTAALMLIVNGDKFIHLAVFLVNVFAFYLGFSYFTRLKFVNIFVYKISGNRVGVGCNGVSILMIVAVVIFLILMLTNLFVFYRTGFAIFSDNPTSAKIDNFTDGAGVLRRILWTLTLPCLISSAILIFLDKNKLFFSIIIIILMLFSIVDGSKSALLIYIFVLYILSTHPRFIGSRFAGTIKIGLPILFLLAASVAVLVLFIEASRDISAAFYSLLNRLLYSGDVVIYYYDDAVIGMFDDYDFGLYLYNIFNPVLGMLRLQDYTLPTGYLMVYEYNQGELGFTTILGPNTPYYIVADMYFGAFFGAFYSFFVGALVSFFRKLFYSIKSNLFILMICGVLYLNSFILIAEAPLFFGRLADMFFIFIPVAAFAWIVYSTAKVSHR